MITTESGVLNGVPKQKKPRRISNLRGLFCVGWPFSLVNQRTFHRVCKGLNSFYADYTARLKPVQADYFESACWFQFVFVIDHACSPLLKRMVSCPPGITVISSTILRTRSSSYSFNSIAVSAHFSVLAVWLRFCP